MLGGGESILLIPSYTEIAERPVIREIGIEAHLFDEVADALFDCLVEFEAVIQLIVPVVVPWHPRPVVVCFQSVDAVEQVATIWHIVTGDAREHPVDRFVSFQLFEQVDGGVLVSVEGVFDCWVDGEDVLRRTGVELVDDRVVWMSDSPPIGMDFLARDVVAFGSVDRDSVQVFE